MKLTEFIVTVANC